MIRRSLIACAVFTGVLVVGGWPSASVARGFSTAYCPVANVPLRAFTFGGRGHARLQPQDPAMARAEGAFATDTSVVLTADGQPGRALLGISLRRDAYLPLLIVLAVVLAAPIPWRRKLRCAGWGLLIELGVTWVALVLLVGSALAAGLPGLYGPTATALWDLAARTLLMPPGNRFVIPLGIGIGLALANSRALMARSAPLPCR